MFQRLLREVRYCDDFDSLLDVARTLNKDCIPPLEDASVLNTVKKVWEYEITGNNWVGRRARASTDREEILVLSRDPYAAHLLNLLRVSTRRRMTVSLSTRSRQRSCLAGIGALWPGAFAP